MHKNGIAGLYTRSRGGCPVRPRTRQVIRTQETLKCGFRLLSLVSMRIDVKDSAAVKRLRLRSCANGYSLRGLPAIRIGQIKRAFVFRVWFEIQDAPRKHVRRHDVQLRAIV